MSETARRPDITAGQDDDIRERLRMIEDKLSLIIEILSRKNLMVRHLMKSLADW
ncbi:hypothetical protein [Komagataeibacter nataicola]|uniref:hypothetical protein n=1 Tax=Komagataeibacter nataicola TaxID=265960 RepID=UPI0038D20B63